jgi:hypothetical protein
MAEYPITPISYDTDKDELKKKWQKLLEENLDIAAFQIACGLDYYCYGNCYVSIMFPFKKYLRCSNNSCKNEIPITDADYKFRNFEYILSCPKCNTMAPSTVHDRPTRSVTGIRLIRWGAENISPVYNEITGETVYTYDMQTTLKNDILIGKKEIIESTPHVFIEALRVNRSVQLGANKIFHLKRASLAEQSFGMGIPLPFPVLKSAYYMQVLQKSQEAIALEHLVPLRILFPQASSPSGDPYVSVDLSNWTEKVEDELAKWRFDQNHIPIMPLPVGQETVGGDGRALLLHQELRLWSEHIIAGMGVPNEFIFGGLSWTGSNVSLRMLENTFLTYRNQQLRMIKWIIQNISVFMGWPSVDIHFTDFKMADDLQKKQLYLTMSTMGKVSDRTLLDEFRLDAALEKKQLEDQYRYDTDRQKKLAISAAEAQGEASLVSMKYQKKASEVQMQDQAAMQQQPPEKQEMMARSMAGQIEGLPEEQKSQMLTELQTKYPDLANAVAGILGQQKGNSNGKSNGKSNGAMKPLPEQKPPRRQGAII